MIYALGAVLAALVWLATRQITDPLRRAGVAVTMVGVVLAVVMSWMAFPFLIVAVVGGVLIGVSFLRDRGSA